jgi:hypothetical protein
VEPANTVAKKHAAPVSAVDRMAVAAALALSVVVMVFGVHHHMDALCASKEWPSKEFCGEDEITPATELVQLANKIRANPADSNAWISHVLIQSQSPDLKLANYPEWVKHAVQLAPQDRRIQGVMANEALRSEDWVEAVNWLIRMAQENDDANAPIALARLVTHAPALQAMLDHVKPSETKWIEMTLEAMRRTKQPVAQAMPIIVKALSTKSLSPVLAQRLLGQLKAEGHWLEAHAVWTTWLGQPAQFIFNGKFDRELTEGGFDWEIAPEAPSKAGALVDLMPQPGRGGVLQIEFTGRKFPTPLVRQVLVVLPGRYVFQGEFLASRLQSKEGLVWSWVCAADGREVGRTSTLKDTTGKWQKFRFEIDIPPGCGSAVGLQLQAAAYSESLAGIKGVVMFDNFILETSHD